MLRLSTRLLSSNMRSTHQFLQMRLFHGSCFATTSVQPFLQKRSFYNADTTQHVGLKTKHLSHDEKINHFITAVKENDTKAVAVIAQQEPSLITAQTNAVDNTPLHQAAMDGNDRIIDMLCTKDNVNHKCHCTLKRTPLHYAVEGGHYSSVKKLLNKGADPNDQDEKRRTALDYALERNDLEIAALLVKHGGQANIQKKQQQAYLPKINAKLFAKQTTEQLNADIENKANKYVEKLEKSKHAKTY